MNTRISFAHALVGLASLTVGCRSSSHAVEPSTLGRSVASSVLTRALREPGPVQLTTVVSADWEIHRSGLINLEHEAAKAAGLRDGPEPIQIYFHVLRHPERGTFLVDTGVETMQRIYPDAALFRGLVGKVMNIQKLEVHHGLGEWLRAHRTKLAGVFLTHLHMDHVAGMRDVPRGTPIYAGPGELEQRSFQNLFIAPLMKTALAGQGSIREWQFDTDPEGQFAGVIDIFGDQSVFAIHVPGHTAGSTAYLVRSSAGPVLLVGDACHTSWGWTHGVEPGSFSSDQESSRVSLERLQAFVRAHPEVEVRLGHQPLARVEIAPPGRGSTGEHSTRVFGSSRASSRSFGRILRSRIPSPQLPPRSRRTRHPS